MRNDKENVIVNLSFQFAISIVEFVELLEKKGKYIFAKQVLKSGTSIGANIREAQNAESYLDFVHKMKIAAKEIDETEYWLQLCKHSKTYPTNEELSTELSSINKIVSKIISTSKRKLKK